MASGRHSSQGFHERSRKYLRPMGETIPRCTTAMQDVIGRGGTTTRRFNKHGQDKLHPVGWLREGPPGGQVFVPRPDSRTNYQPRIDIPSVHDNRFAPPENLYELHADAADRANRATTAAPTAMPPAYPSRSQMQTRREAFTRAGQPLASIVSVISNTSPPPACRQSSGCVAQWAHGQVCFSTPTWQGGTGCQPPVLGRATAPTPHDIAVLIWAHAQQVP